MKKYVLYLVAFLLVLSQFFVSPVISKINFSDCKDIQVIFADGSGAKIDGTDNNYLDFKDAVSGVLDRTNLTYSFYELGSDNVDGNSYPATSIGTESLSAFFTTLGAYFSAAKGYSYGESFEEGSRELFGYITKKRLACNDTRFILSGFSQGAGVISMTLPDLGTDLVKGYDDHIIYVATFGDAKLYLPEGWGLWPAACRGEGLSDYRMYVPDCDVYQGILGAQKPYVPGGMEGEIGTWCNHYDMICTSRINWFNFDESATPHGSYGNTMNADRLYYDAAEVIYQKVLEEFDLVESEPEPEKTYHNLAILIDTSGSMADLIDDYKNEAMRLAKNVFDGGGKVALYEYRDYQHDGYEPKQHCNFETCSLEKIEATLNSLLTDGGGDDPESLLSTAMKAMNELEWEQGAVKSIVALTDAGYHDKEWINGEKLEFRDVILQSLKIDPVNFYTITPESIMPEYASLTSETGGKSFSSTGELEFSTEYIFNRPDVKLARDEYIGLSGEEFYFDASQTVSGSKIVKYEWDLDLDGVFETETTIPYVKAKYNEGISGFMQVKAIDENGFSGTMSARVEVLNDTDSKATTSLSIEKIEENKENNEVSIKFSTDAFRTLVYINDVLIGVTDSHEITIGDLDFSVDNSIKLVPYGDGISYPGESDEVRIEASSKGAKDEESPEKDANDEKTAEELEEENSESIFDPTKKEPYLDDSEKQKRTYPKNPDCGIVK